jgi:hypothetical protein
VTARTTTTTHLHETECDRCHRTEITTTEGGGYTEPSRRLPEGWMIFFIAWTGQSGRRQQIEPELCPACQRIVTLAGLMAMVPPLQPGPPQVPPDRPYRKGGRP